MKKILFAILILLGACSQDNAMTLKTGSYKLKNSMHNVPTILTLSKDGKLNAKVVNVIMGEYTTSQDNITITLGGTTMMMGPQEEMEAEQNFIKALLLIRKYKMQESNLVLILENGGELIFEPYTEPK